MHSTASSSNYIDCNQLRVDSTHKQRASHRIGLTLKEAAQKYVNLIFCVLWYSSGLLVCLCLFEAHLAA